MQNVHRYFLYLALFFLIVLSIDVWKHCGFLMDLELESARLFWQSTLFCSAATRLAVTRSDIWLADFWINFPGRRHAIALTRA